MRLDETIVAVSSPPGVSMRGLVRLSGPDASRILAQHCDLTEPSARTLHRVRFDDRLPCLVCVFPGPKSYTGEDLVEIQTVGHPVVLERVVNRCIESGARRAEPGEFSARAYFNGRVSLVEAEGIAATIAAESDAQLRAAQMLTEGRVGRVAEHFADELAQSLALLEAEIDFVEEEDVVAIEPRRLLAIVASLEQRIGETLDRATGTEALSSLPHVVLAGAPNAGKSTLFNALLGRSRAVVRDVSGTTRDVLIEPLHIDPLDPESPEVMLVDVAGLDASADGLNPRMQRAAHDAIRRADLVLWLRAADALAESDDAPNVSAPVIPIITKSDLLDDTEPEPQTLHVSAATGTGLDRVRTQIVDTLAASTQALGADALALLPRHEHALTRAHEDLGIARDMLEPMADARSIHDPELLAAHLRSALDALAELAGEITPDDVLGRIFAGFCIGK